MSIYEQLQKNHFIPASVIGIGWGIPNPEKKGNRYNFIQRLDLVNYLKEMEFNKLVQLQEFTSSQLAEQVCYSRVVLSSTENDLGITKIENNFSKLLLNNITHISSQSIQKTLQNYVILQMSRNPLRYLFNEEDVSPLFSNDVFFKEKIIFSFNPSLKNIFNELTLFFENNSVNISFLEIPNSESIILGSTTCLSHQSSINNITFTEKLKQFGFPFPNLLHTKVCLVPFNKNTFLLTTYSNTDTISNDEIEKINLFFDNENNKINITRLWNWWQLITSTELIFAHNTNISYFNSCFDIIPEEVQNLSDDLSKSHLDYHFNKLFDHEKEISKKNILKIEAQFLLYKNKVEEIFTNSDGIIDLKFNKTVITLSPNDCEINYLDKIDVILHLTNSSIYSFSLIIMHNGEVLLNEDGELYFFSNDFFTLSEKILNYINKDKDIIQGCKTIAQHKLQHNIQGSDNFTNLKSITFPIINS